ncbi:hypothetical protein ENBRE01_1068 [Enteropsectra breve]|nr:hypothetical protein ENBRE01_1068 [Enteropsectra breve]
MFSASSFQLFKLLLILAPIFSLREETSLPSSFFDIQNALDARNRNDPPKVYYRKTPNIFGDYGNFIFAIDDNLDVWRPVLVENKLKLTRPGYETETIPLLLSSPTRIKITGPWLSKELTFSLNFERGEYCWSQDAACQKNEKYKGTDDFAEEKYIEVSVYPTERRD